MAEGERRSSRPGTGQDVSRDGVAGVRPASLGGHFNQLIMHKGQIKSEASAAVGRGRSVMLVIMLLARHYYRSYS